MFGENPPTGYMPMPILDLRAGHLYSVAVSLLVFGAAIYTGWIIFLRGNKNFLGRNFSFFLLALGFYWLLAATIDFSSWLNFLKDIFWIAFPVKFFSILPHFFLLHSLTKKVFVQSKGVTGVCLVFGIAYLLTTYFQDSTSYTTSYWGVQWRVGDAPLLIRIFGFLFPLLFLVLWSIVKEYFESKREGRFANYTLDFGALIFILLDYSQLTSKVEWLQLIMRLFYILIAVGSYFYFVSWREEKRMVPLEEKVSYPSRIRVPYFVKLLLLFGLLSVLPIAVSSLLMFFSFKEIIDLYVYKPLLWNLKAPREAFLEALNHVEAQAMVLVVLTGLLVGIAAVVASRALANSLRWISQGMEKVSKGDFSFKLLPDSNDEVGDVVKYFNQMSLELKQARDLLENWNRELEVKIKERTEDLQTLFEISRAMSSTLDLELLINRTLSLLLPILSAENYCLLMPDEKGIYRARICQGCTIPDYVLEGELTEQEAKRLLGTNSVLINPLRSKGKVFGVLVLGRKEINKLPKERENLLKTVSEELGVVLENIGIYEKEKEAVARLTELDRLKNEFISMVSHELRTPVTSADGFVSLFLAGAMGTLTPEQINALTIVKENHDRLLTLINRLLNFSKIESGRFTLKRELLSMTEVIKAALDVMKPKLEKKQAELELKLDAKNVNFMGDREKIIEVFINLIENAIKFSKVGEPLRLKLSTRDAENFIEVTIEDNGIGIAKEHLEKIFNKFYQVEETMTRTVGGVGLGLAIVKEIIGKHQGRIWAESPGVGRGARFIFAIPVAEKG